MQKYYNLTKVIRQMPYEYSQELTQLNNINIHKSYHNNMNIYFDNGICMTTVLVPY